MSSVEKQKNVFGEEIEACCESPITGFFQGWVLSYRRHRRRRSHRLRKHERRLFRIF